jgi:hypothetical protein
VHWSYFAYVRPHGKAFSVVKNEVKVRLATTDVFGQVEGVTLTVLGSLGVVRCWFVEDPNPFPDYVCGVLVNNEGDSIRDVEMDLLKYPFELKCFLLYKNSFNFLRLLMVRCADPETEQY